MLFQSLIYGLVFWVILLSSYVTLIPYYILKHLGFKKQAWFYVGSLSKAYSRFIIFIAGCKIYVEGVENIPKGKNYCIISNHQAYMDILTLMAVSPEGAGYIAKKSLAMIPGIRIWMMELGCYFMKRNSLKDGLKGILFGVDRVKNGFPMVLFPEGTRSKGPVMGEFKSGGLKLATKAKALAVPVSIQGSYRVLEATGRVTPSWIGVKIHPPVDTKLLTRQEESDLAKRLWDTIHEGVVELQKISPNPIEVK